MKRITFLAAFLILLATAIYSIARQSAGSFVPVTDVMLENPDPADWLMWRRTLNSWGYSPLDQINRTECPEYETDLDARHGSRRSGGHAARLPRRDVFPEPGARSLQACRGRRELCIRSTGRQASFCGPNRP